MSTYYSSETPLTNARQHGYDPTLSDAPFFYDRRRGASEVIGSDDGRLADHSRRKVMYFHPKDIGLYHFGPLHPMKAYRLNLTNELVLSYGLHKHMTVHSPRKASEQEIEEFHGDDYIDYLSKVTPNSLSADMQYNTSRNLLPGASDYIDTHRIGSDDCPAFTGLFSYCQQYAGASLAAARKLTMNGGGAEKTGARADIAINWSGGLHHAKKREASGFCYVNDIVLAILELLRVHTRVLYIDIDVHHGDGVQEAFYRSNRVMTVSFHKYGDGYFPGTGNVNETGLNEGKYFSLNVPLQDGIDDGTYISTFKGVMEPTIRAFRPSCVVLQCGADSLGSDRLGTFNLSIKAHGECVRYIKSFQVPLLVLGGGGYRQSSVARCWTYETSLLAGVEISNDLPSTHYDAYFEGMVLHPPLISSIPNKNTQVDLENIRRRVREQLRALNGAPSVEMQEIPPSLTGLKDDEELGEEEMMEVEWGNGLAGDLRVELDRVA